MASLDSKVEKKYYSLPTNKREIAADNQYDKLKEHAKRFNIFIQFVDIRTDAVRDYRRDNKINGDWLSYTIGLTESVNKHCEIFLEPYLDREEKEKSYEREKEFKKRQTRLNL